MARHIITNLNQLDSIIGRVIEEEIVKFGEEVKKALQMEVRSIFYGREGYHPNAEETAYYKRTWQLIECITCSPVKVSGNKYSVKIYYDTDKLIPMQGEGGYFPSHMSVVDGRPFQEGLPYTIEYGNPSRIYGWEAFHIVENLRNRLADDKAILQWFVSAFQRRGFNVIEN